MNLRFVALAPALVLGCSLDVERQDHSAENPVAVPEALASAPTVGAGDIQRPVVGPKVAYDYGKDTAGYVLVKNWDFGKNGTIRTIDDLNEHFQYHDQFNQIANGAGKYGAYTVAPDREHALNASQPIEGVNTSGPVRKFFDSSMKTYLVGLNGKKTVNPTTSKAGCGSFQAKWKLPAGGSRLGMDLIWETRVRYETPPYFWFSLWTSGNRWDRGAEMDVVESFGFDNGGSDTNYDGGFWHSSVVGGTSETNYHRSWPAAMASYGIVNYDASEYHTWTWVYETDNTFVAYNDGKVVQRGSIHWTLGAKPGVVPIDMSFIFDGAWGHTDIDSVDKTLPVSELAGKYYEWDYSRVYLREGE
jgi:hypothetical protein